MREQTGVLKAGRGWSGRGRPVVPRGELAGAWPPRSLRALARSERVRGHCGPDCASGPEVERRPGKKQIEFFKLFSIPMTFKCKFEQFQSVSNFGPKIKVALKFILYNFVKRS